jgi:hypothetical protein
LAAAERERERFIDAIRLGNGALEMLVPLLEECDKRIKTLSIELERLSSSGPSPIDQLSAARRERWLTARLATWRELLAPHSPHARDALKALLPADKPILFIPQGRGYLLKGATRLGVLLFDDAPLAIASARVASPGGFEPPLPP